MSRASVHVLTAQAKYYSKGYWEVKVESNRPHHDSCRTGTIICWWLKMVHRVWCELSGKEAAILANGIRIPKCPRCENEHCSSSVFTQSPEPHLICCYQMPQLKRCFVFVFYAKEHEKLAWSLHLSWRSVLSSQSLTSVGRQILTRTLIFLKIDLNLISFSWEYISWFHCCGVMWKLTAPFTWRGASPLCESWRKIFENSSKTLKRCRCSSFWSLIFIPHNSVALSNLMKPPNVFHRGKSKSRWIPICPVIEINTRRITF